MWLWGPSFGIEKGIPIVYERPDSISILSDEEALSRLPRYFDILRRKAVAKFQLAKLIPVDYKKTNDLDELWKIHDDALKEFLEKLENNSEDELKQEWMRKRDNPPDPNLLTLKRDIAWRLLEACIFCERKCRVNRLKGERGFCGLDHKAYISSVFVHIGEEPELVPSFTIFFSRCNFRCVFCQNWDISQFLRGNNIPAARLAQVIDEEWRANHIRNTNWVGGEPTPNLHYILDVLVLQRESVPVVWNSNFYMSEETMKLLIGVVDVWLPDFKYGKDECAIRLSAAPRYFEVVSRNHKIANQYGEMIIRHLVLPNHLECCTKKILKWIAENLDLSRVRVNVMKQYRPEYQAHKYPEIARRITHEEWREAITYARNLGLSLTI